MGGVIAHGSEVIPREGLIFQDEGSFLGNASILNITGTGYTLSLLSGVATLDLTGGSGSGIVESVVAGTNITVDNTDPANPIISATGGSGSPAGSDTQVQFNDGGSFGADAGLTYNKTTDTLTVAGEIVTPSVQAASSAGGELQTNSGAVALHYGSGGSANGTLYGGWNYDNGTANTILSLGASKTLTSLSTATYPSLTELSYVKGVTSAIQTQINAKQDTLVSGTNIKTVNGNSLLGSGNISISGSGIDLQTDGTPNGDQTLLNLIGGTNITLTDNGTGSVTIDASGSGSPSGSNTEVQFNNSGAFGGDPEFTFDNVGKILYSTNIETDTLFVSNGATINNGFAVESIEVGYFGLSLKDITETYKLSYNWEESGTSDRSLSFKVNDGNRTIDLSGDLTVSATATISGNAGGVSLLAQSNTAASLTGTTTETALATYTLPANTLGANGMLRITTFWSCNNTANNKNPRVRFGGTSGTIYLTDSLNSRVTGQGITHIRANNATNAQKAISGTNFAAHAFTSGTVAILTSAVDTTSNVDIVFSGQLANSGDSVVLEGYTIELIQ